MGTCRRLAGLVSPAAIVGAVLACSTAGAATTQITTPFTSVVLNPCNGELVDVVGQSHMVTVINDNKLDLQENWPDTYGVGTSGTTYQVNDANHVFAATVPDSGFTLVLRDNFELVSNAASANFLVHVTVEFSFDPTKGFDEKISPTGEECSGPTPP